ncbi:MAG: host specificity protein J, partial [Caulobacteraceae bacterium]|nr:host specificity protein J [Caulobacteraceae bacterium]
MGGAPKQPAQRLPVETKNSLQSRATGRLIDLLGEGPISGLVNGLQSIYLNDTALQNADGTFNFQGVSVETRNGDAVQDALKGFPYIESEVGVGVKVTQSTPVVRTVTQLSADAARVTVRLPALFRQDTATGDITGTSVQFKIEVKPNGGSYKLAPVNYEWTTIASGTTTSNVAAGIRVTLSKNINGPIGSTQSANFEVNYRAVGAGSWIQLGSSTVTQKISQPFPYNGQPDNTEQVSASFYVSDLTPDDYEIQVVSGTLIKFEEATPSYITISGKQSGAYEESYRVELEGTGPWDIRLTRITADAAVSSLQNEIYFSSFATLIDTKPYYPYCALAGITLDSQKFGSDAPSRAYEVKGLLLQIPDNYNPVTRVYTGVWTGTFTTAYTDNPAWVLYGLLTNPRWGLGRHITAAQVDKFALYSIAQYCDELVDDGFGGTEPRFTFNGVINTQEEAFNVISAVTSSFRGMGYWASGAVTCTQDSPSDPAKLITPANVEGGLLNYSGTGKKARHTVALVSWNDPSENYKLNIAVVEDKDSINQYGWNPIDVVAFGCTSEGQAVRFGRWILDSEKSETETVNFVGSLDMIDLRPGEIISVADPAYMSLRYGGRAVAATTTSVTIDKAVTISSLETYTLTITMPDGSLEERVLNNSAGSASVLTFASALPDTPVNGAMWILSSTALAPRKFRVISVVEKDELRYDITALFHDPTKYARIEQNLELIKPVYTSFRSGVLLPASDISYSEFLYKAGPSVKSAVTVSWLPPDDARVNYYEVSYIGPGDVTYKLIGETKGTSIDLLDTLTGDYTIKVVGVNGLNGQRSPEAIRSFSLSGLLSPPADVTGFNMSVIGGNANLSWLPVADLDLSHYVIKYTTDASPSWAASQLLVDRVSSNQQSVAVPAMVGSYLIKAVDTSGIYSVNEAIISSNVAVIEGLNVVETITEQPTWAGTKTDTGVNSGALRLTGADTVGDWPLISDIGVWGIGAAGLADVGYYDFDCSGLGYIDLGAVYTSRLTSNILATGDNLLNTVGTWPIISGVSSWGGANVSNWGVTLLVSTTNDNPSGSPTWSGYSAFIVGDYTARAFRFKLALYSYEYGVTPVVSEAGVTIDMPDRVASNRNLTSNAAGDTITFSPAFKATPAIGISGNNLATGDYCTVTAQSRTGFTVRFFNSAGTGISRNYD